ncbi:hypothetical protein ACSTJV_23665, partial [Vibrio parahaemolyticus]
VYALRGGLRIEPEQRAIAYGKQRIDEAVERFPVPCDLERGRRQRIEGKASELELNHQSFSMRTVRIA